MHRAGFLAFAVMAPLSLSACETVTKTMSDTYAATREKITSIEMPSLTDNATKAAETEIIAEGCPAVETTPVLSEIHQFMAPEDPQENERISSLAFANVTHNCRHRGNNVIVELSMIFEGQLGPKARVFDNDRPSFAYPYFIAIENSEGDILAKEIFASTMSYGKTQQSIAHEENIRQIIPLAPGDTGDDYKITIGFQLSGDELAYNETLDTDEDEDDFDSAITIIE